MARGLPFKTVSPQNLPKLCSGKGSISKQIKSVYPSHITVAAFFLKQSRMYNLPSSALCTFSGIAMTREKTHQYFSWQLSKHKLHQTLLLTEAIHKSKKKLNHSWRNPSMTFKKGKWLVHCLPVRGTWSWVQPNTLNKADKKKKKILKESPVCVSTMSPELTQCLLDGVSFVQGFSPRAGKHNVVWDLEDTQAHTAALKSTGKIEGKE